MKPLTLIQYTGDSKIHTIPLEWDDAAFTPGGDYVLTFTLKRSPADPDSAALVQKVTGTGITHSGSNALVQFVTEDTLSREPNPNLYWGVRARHVITGDWYTVKDGRMNLKQAIDRNAETSIPVLTHQPPVQVIVPPVILRTAEEGTPTPNYAETSFPYDMDRDLRFEQIDNGDPPTIEFVGVNLGADLVTVAGRAITVQFGTNFGSANTSPSEVIDWITAHPEASAMIVAMLKPGQTGTGTIGQPAFGPVTLSGAAPVPLAIGQLLRVGDAAPYKWFRADSVSPVVWTEIFQIDNPTDGDLIERVNGVWVRRSISEIKNDLGLDSVEAIAQMLGLPSYESLTAANAALPIGKIFYNSGSQSLEITTA